MIRKACVVLFIALMILWPYFAFGHEHVDAQGQAQLYDEDCCHERDCFAVSADDVEELPNGDWRYVPENKVFSKKDGKVRMSKNSKYHVCLSLNARWPYCIYILQGS